MFIALWLFAHLTFSQRVEVEKDYSFAKEFKMVEDSIESLINKQNSIVLRPVKDIEPAT